MEMKKLLESINSIEECGTDMSPSSQMHQPDKVRMNVNLSAEGKDGIEDLLTLMKAAGADNAAPVSRDTMPMVKSKSDDMRDYLAAMDDPEMEEVEDVEEWDNSPEEEYSDHNAMTKDLSGGLNREKKSYKATQDGDNPMALEQSIKEQLLQALSEKKKKDPCWKDYEMIGMKEKNGKEVPNCVPKKKD